MKTSPRTFAAITLLFGLTLAGTNAVLAQTRYDFYRYDHSGYGQCTTDEGYGRYGSCDASGGS
jgi:hypothetical protein